MTDKIIEILKSRNIDAWEITDTVTEGWEFYFIKQELDQNRVRDVEHIVLNVYRKLEDGKILGSASQEIPPTATEKEIEKTVDELYERASFVKNPYYELNKKKVEVEKRSFNPEETAKAYIEAMQQIPETSTADINSYEIFAESCTRRYVNSEGIDVTESYPNSMVEVVVNARNDEHEIELYRMYNAGTCDSENLKKEIEETLRYGKDRLVTKPTPALGKATVIIPSADATRIYDWIGTRMYVSMKYRGYSDWEVGKDIIPGAVGDKISFKLVKELPNSSLNRQVDKQGAAIRDMYVIKDNIAESYWGERQFAYYLGVEDSFICGNYEVEGGSATEAELRCGQYLEAVEFSDFSVDPITGDFAGEIRLAYYHDGDKVTPVSGGSVSGSLLEILKNVKLSKEKRQFDNFLVPSIIKMENVTIAGVE
ncbi:metallopeptidase TldD-related protein [Butyrivibrio sp. YAB3001]|uniref:metallopeptidase TldD-related protein n=1 Tax=Butyrivibrio sp. YAB3001 TaxID=1520812 RepID=UPI0008F65048|nr:metallopeptidase TldD-related protein [Butyrivibrio sp. YAB3001]SFB86491.1 PmbA protein [Butyrivibrio sp. YAB3001]